MLFSTAVGTALTAVFLCLLAVPAVAQTPNPICSAVQRGVFNDASQTFTRSSSGNDYLFECAGDGADLDDAKVEELFEAALRDASSDAVDFGPASARLILKISNASVDVDVEDAYPNEDDPKGGYVIDGSGVKFYDLNFPGELTGDLKIDSHATVVAGGTKGGIKLWVEDDVTDRKVVLRNYGQVTTSGNDSAFDGVEVGTEDADVEGYNESGGTISTTGRATRGLTVFSISDDDMNPHDGSALAVNRGTITTAGDAVVFGDPGEKYLRRAYGVYSLSEAGDADLQNYGTVTTTGTAARGLNAYVESGDGSASIRNYGTVTTRGNAVNLVDNSINYRGAAEGVRAGTDGTGDADAVNESTGTITTQGLGATGLAAYAKVADANVVNRGKVSTAGKVFKVRGEVKYKAHGLHANVWEAAGAGNAAAHNHGTVTTGGTGGRGVVAETQNASGTATATNRGTVTTTGGADHDADQTATADGVVAFAKGTGDALATNESGGTITVSGQGAKGVWAAVYDQGAGGATATNKGTVTTTTTTPNKAFYFADRSGTDDDFYHLGYGVASYTDGTGASTAVNAAGGMVTTKGAGAIGTFAWADGSGNAMAENRGTVNTTGDTIYKTISTKIFRFSAMGIFAFATGGNAQATNRGTITTTGVGGIGMRAESETTSGTATAVNHGAIATTGGKEDQGTDENVATADGVFASADGSGTATATNERTGTISVAGDGAKGLWAAVYGGGAATATNRGTVITRGDLYFLDRGSADSYRSASGVGAYTESSGDAMAVNAAGGTVTTEGTGAAGLIAWAAGAGGDAIAENRGTIRTTAKTDPVVTGAQWASTFYAPAAKSHGVAAVSEQGNAEIRLVGGTVAVAGEASGLFAMTADDAAKTITVNMSGGAKVIGDTAARFVGGRATVTLQDTGRPADKNVLQGNVYFGDRRDRLRLRYGEIHGDINFGKGRDRLQLHAGAVIQGDIDFGADGGGYTTLAPSDPDYQTIGCHPVDVDPTDDTKKPRGDVLLIYVNERNAPTVRIEGAVRNVNRFCKRGKGAAYLQAGINFKGSQAHLEDGQLILGGHMDLGDTGTLTVKDRAALIFQLGDLSSDEYGKVTAKTVTFEDDDSDADTEATPTVQMTRKKGVSLDADDVTAVKAIELFNTGSLLQKPTGSAAKALTGLSVTTVAGEEVGTITPVTVPGDSPRTKGQLGDDFDGTKIGMITETVIRDTPVGMSGGDTAVGGSGGGGGSGGIVAVGGLALLVAMLNPGGAVLDPGDGLDPTGEEEESAAELVVTAVDPVHRYRVRDGDLEYQARSFEGGLPTAQVPGLRASAEGWSFGVNTRRDSGFWAGFSAAPEISMAAVGESADRPANTRFIGNSRALHGGYRGETFFARATLAEGVYDAHNALADPMSSGMVAGVMKVRHRQSELTLGVVTDFGQLRVVPKVSWFSGRLAGGAYEATNALMRTAVPATMHTYRGVGGSLSLASRGWLQTTDGAWRWRPQLQLTAHRLRATGFATGAPLHYADHRGITSFRVPAMATALPRSVMGLTATVGAKQRRATGWRVKMGYGGVAVEGQYYHGVVFGAQKRF